MQQLLYRRKARCDVRRLTESPSTAYSTIQTLSLAAQGNWNAGNKNNGDSNDGDENNGDLNEGDRNTGTGNSGDANFGDWNSGDANKGDYNSGSHDLGDYNQASQKKANHTLVPGGAPLPEIDEARITLLGLLRSRALPPVLQG